MAMPAPEIIPGLPVFLDLRGRSCLVLGGEGEAVGKVEALLRAGARVLLLAERVDPVLVAQMDSGRLICSQESFRPDHLNDVWFVLSTLQDSDVNAILQVEAERRRIFVNVVDHRRYCSALWPAVIHRPPVTVAFSTGGASPALAGYLRRKIAAALPEKMGALATWLSGWRGMISVRFPELTARGNFWRRVLDDGVVERYLAGDIHGAEKMILQELPHQSLDDQARP
ncbi:MAG: bifunctional precorrin-2 dehydrogenase/sirohydrochlorin ferrochelatase [Magnetococcales bacterium]|nr:bifunctional precorrin-2 dehydrogenase/sirohydrochlorin ferrochelatase [Magnetococcales bacterium]MBF0321718.1 bifunctional precorrin-2 dehydrogenase/sirohydrochlorin ferrochelatase [Magnetococcales bacterium]